MGKEPKYFKTLNGKKISWDDAWDAFMSMQLEFDMEDVLTVANDMSLSEKELG